MGGNDKMKEDKVERGKKSLTTIEITKIGKDISDLKQSSFELKKELAQFVFQTVSVTMGLFVILLAVLIGFSANWDFEETGINIVIGLLVFLVVLIAIWLIAWVKLNFWKK